MSTGMSADSAVAPAWQALPTPPSLLGESPFWHPDEAALYWVDIPGRALARGRFTVVDARPGDLTVIRWFAPSRALASLMIKGDAFGGGAPTLTALGLWGESVDTIPPTALVEVRPFTALRRIDVSDERLVLPAGYTEAPWPGYEHVQQVFPTSADEGAHWKRPPL